MQRLNGIVALAVTVGLTATHIAPCQEPTQGNLKVRPTILDAQPRVILITGGGQLTKKADAQRLIDLFHRYYANKCPHHFEVVDAQATKSTKDGQDLADALRPALAKAKEMKLPIIVLSQLPPLVMKPAANSIPRNEKDVERIKAYGNIFADYAKRVCEQGADLVVLGMEGANGPNQSDPQAAGSLAHLWHVSEDIAKRSLPGVAVGPRIFQTFDKNRHLYRKNDHHITDQGKLIVTHLWFQALCNLDGIAIPEWSQKEVAAALKK